MDHRSFLTGYEGYVKMGDWRSVKVVKVKEFQEKDASKAFSRMDEACRVQKSQGPQGGKVTSWVRDFAWLMIHRCSREHYVIIHVQGQAQTKKSMINTTYFTRGKVKNTSIDLGHRCGGPSPAMGRELVVGSISTRGWGVAVGVHWDSGYLAEVEVDPRGISLRDDTIVRVSDEPHLEQDSDPEVQAEIDECFAYADALRDRGIDARVVVEAVDQDETETGVRGLVEVRVERVTHPVMPEDIPEPAQEGAVEVTYETLGDLVQRFHDHTQAIPVHRIQAIKGVQREQGHNIVGVESTITALTEWVAELERDNRRLRGTMSVES
ncbi:hypothetical protein Tco_1254554 [Tanacetum coccineum]